MITGIIMKEIQMVILMEMGILNQIMEVLMEI